MRRVQRGGRIGEGMGRKGRCWGKFVSGRGPGTNVGKLLQMLRAV